ncbi:dicarboxylate/amino acid:cation symporter [Facklamia lactis]|uniref:dicarboxylate/amino acid:cation symporter n=1 Tax=Facklamia lactis TaxID=2749967 RepID=UPI0018CEAB50|nr:dicarboxylate/amino acid:cation symporter [Facklamia lactis]MBG9979407.1 dicarboxylate/amino acid:cation symporter [Facklamia lactis]
MTSKFKKLSLTKQILLGLFLGALFGLAIHFLLPQGNFRDKVLVDGILYIVGNGFLRLIQMIVVPLVFFSIASGAISMGDTGAVGKVGIKTLAFYFLTTAVAIVIALFWGRLINPGSGVDLLSIDASGFEGTEAPNFVETILNIIPSNPIAAMAEGEMLQIIVFAMATGIIVGQLPDKLSLLTRIIEEGNTFVFSLTDKILLLAPYGIFALIARTFAQLGFDSIMPLISYMFAVISGLFLQFGLVYLPLIFLFTRLNVMTFIKKFIPVATFAFSSASSSATIPVSLQATDDMGISRKVSAFSIPLGSTINMDGTAIMLGIAVIFVANLYGIELDMADYINVILTATLTSIGAAGVPGIGAVLLSITFTSVGLPLDGVALIMGIDRLLDMARTVTNVAGDIACTLVISKTENALDLDQYNSTVQVASDEF